MVKSITACVLGVVAAATLPLAGMAQNYSEPGSTRVRNPGIQVPPTAHEVDLDYCFRLSSVYLRYIGMDDRASDKRRYDDIEGQLAVDKCKSGDPAASIPVLERKLVNNRLTLPPRG